MPWSTAQPCQNTGQSPDAGVKLFRFEVSNIFYFSPYPPVPVPPPSWLFSFPSPLLDLVLHFSFTEQSKCRTPLLQFCASTSVRAAVLRCSVLVPRPRWPIQVLSLSLPLVSLSQALALSLFGSRLSLTPAVSPPLRLCACVCCLTAWDPVPVCESCGLWPCAMRLCPSEFTELCPAGCPCAVPCPVLACCCLPSGPSLFSSSVPWLGPLANWLFGFCLFAFGLQTPG